MTSAATTANRAVAPPSRARAWLSAVRPATLTAAIGPVALGTALAYADGTAHYAAALAALMSALFIQIGTNLYNDAADFERGADDHNRIGPARATQRGWLSAGQIKAAAAASFAIAFVLGGYLVYVGGWPIVLIGVASLLCGYLYTGGPYPLAYVGLGDVFVLAFFGVAAVCGTYFVQAGHVTISVLLWSLAIGALATAILVVNNLRDRVGDAAAGKRTTVVRFGAKAARWQYAMLLAGAMAVPVALYALGADAPVLLPLLSAPLATVRVMRVSTRDGAALNPELGNTAKLGLLYAALAAIGVVL